MRQETLHSGCHTPVEPPAEVQQEPETIWNNLAPKMTTDLFGPSRGKTATKYYIKSLCKCVQ